MRIDRIPVKAVWAKTLSEGCSPPLPVRDTRILQFTGDSNRLTIEVEPAPWIPDCARRLQNSAMRGSLQLVVGDYTEPGASTKDGLCANSVLIDVDLAAGRAYATASLVGLPPITLWRDRHSSSFSCPLFPRDRACDSVDIEGVADTLRWGHPLDGRTLFKDLVIVPPNSSVSLGGGKASIVEQIRATSSSDSHDSLSQSQLLEAQIAAVLAAAARMPDSDVFLSLSGGLDSRTALVALLTQGHRVPCVSMAGSPYSLDARIAREFCSANALQHQIIEFGEDFVKQLPDLVQQSAGLTGGVACLSQTIDLYLYSQLDLRTSLVRISGHLGNQVGRGGVESIAASGLDDEIFSDDLRAALARRPREPWFVPRMTDAGFSSVLFEQEVHFWSIANYMLGSSKALQLSPYADASLLELSKAALNRDPRFTTPTRVAIRRRDMRHRLIGPPRHQSFQRSLLARHATAGRDVPINWGWKARGGWSARGTSAAARFAADALAYKLGRQYKALKGPMKRVSRALGNPSELVAWPDMLLGPLRVITYDVLLSKRVAESGLFDVTNLRHALDDHFTERVDHHATLYRALEIALGLTSRR